MVMRIKRTVRLSDVLYKKIKDIVKVEFDGSYSFFLGFV